MLYRENTVLQRPVSVLGFGGAAVSGEGGGYGFGEMDEASAERLLKNTWEAGLNLYDTAPIYGFGLSEERFGKYLPKEAIIVSKGGVDWHSSRRVNMTNSPQVIEKMLLESLKRLKRERIDIYMIHWPDKNIDIRRPMEILKKYQEKEAIAHLGLCNTNLEDLKLAGEVGEISFLQSELNVLRTQAFDDLNDSWKKYYTMSWGTLDKGILSGRVTADRKFDNSDARSWAPWWNKKEVSEKIERVKKLKLILDDYNLSLPQFCLNFNLHHYGISSCLIGIKNNKDLIELATYLQNPFNPLTMKEVLNRWSS
jgi:aryl-alcohol dehydrogenase-like predicted oxidoreductase